MNEQTAIAVGIAIIFFILGCMAGRPRRRLSAPDSPPIYPYDHDGVQELPTNPNGLQATEED